MAEYIERAAALSIREPSKSNRYYQTDNLDDAYGQGWDDALCCIECLPIADVMPVVRCENCVDGIESDDNKYIICCRFGIGMEFDDFCSRGDRKNEGNVCVID